MRKVDLRPYNIRVTAGPDVSCPECGKPFPRGESLPGSYKVRDSLVELCFVPAEGCKGRELLVRQTLAEKVAAAQDELLLEDTDWQRLVKAVDHLPGLGRNEVELVRRILDAPSVLVEEKSPEKPPG